MYMFGLLKSWNTNIKFTCNAKKKNAYCRLQNQLVLRNCLNSTFIHISKCKNCKREMGKKKKSEISKINVSILLYSERKEKSDFPN